MSEPQVSFVLPVYNAAAHVRAAVESVLAQTFENFELLAINDGSSDESLRILSEIRDPRLRVLNQTNSGLVSALNRGIQEARAPMIARMDADDFCLPGRLATQVAFLNNRQEIALVGGWVATMDEHDRVLCDAVPFPITHEELWTSIVHRPWVICHPTVLFRREAALAVGLYDPSYKHAEDIDFFARMMSRFRVENQPEVVLRYRLRRGAVSSEFRDHGLVNAQLVRTVMDRWTPGEPFQTTAAERAAADARIAASAKKIGPRAAASTYYCRCGRELLRGSRWGQAMASYAKAAAGTPLRVEAYKGLIAAMLRVGAAPVGVQRQAALL